MSCCSSLCRQVVTDDQGNVMVFSVGGTHATITLSGTPDVNVAIVSHCLPPFMCTTSEYLCSDLLLMVALHNIPMSKTNA